MISQMERKMVRLNMLALAASLLGGCAQIPSAPSSQFVSVPLAVTERYGITRMHPVTWPEACLVPDPTAEPLLGQSLPPGCANNYNLLQMTEHQDDLARGRRLGAAPAAPAVRAAQRYIYGGEGPLGAGVSSPGGAIATPPDTTKETSGGSGSGLTKTPQTPPAPPPTSRATIASGAGIMTAAGVR
jgi:hypothetical protein